jgi:PAS domain S-box-containing protein
MQNPFDVLMSLDMLVLERRTSGVFHPAGPVPAWFGQLYPEAVTALQPIQPGLLSTFLESFLGEADAFWEHQQPGRLSSGVWCETTPGGTAYYLEATATWAGSSAILLIQSLGTAYTEQQAMLQTARETTLAYQRLRRAEAALRHSEGRLAETLAQVARSHDNLLSILNQLRLGTAMLDAQGKVTFLSEACQRLLGKRQEEVAGYHWEHLNPFPAAVKAQLTGMAQCPPEQRTKIPVHLETPAGRRYWMEVEIQDDPRDARGKIVVFYDMTEVQDLRRLLDGKAQFHDLVGKTDAMLEVYRQIREVARVDMTVLIEGATGTGKELVARAIHFASPRQSKPFLAVNCAGLTESLLASQLFGHKRGAFTGAVADQQGVFEAAHGGTLFLDEIGDIPLTVQTSLLRVLQEREITRLGEARPRKVDVRILAATHRNLQTEVANGTFRSDLLYRIRVARIHLPSLRERRQDIPLLVSTFLAQCRATTGKRVDEVSHEAMRYCLAYDWPGNVRELKSAVEFAVIRSRGAVIQVEDLPPEITDPATALTSARIPPGDEKQRLLAALQQARGNRTGAARLLGMSRATFYRRLSSLNIPLDDVVGG